MRFKISIYAYISIDDKNFDWESVDDAREVVKLVAEDTVKEIEKSCNTGAYNFYLGGVAFFPFGRMPDPKEIDRL